MNTNIVIIEDSELYAIALKRAIEFQIQVACTVHFLNPNREISPTFEEFHTEILRAQGDRGIVLLDNCLGKWKWGGANLAPSLRNVISISSDNQRWADHQFVKKAWVYQGDEVAIAELLEIIRKVSKKMSLDNL